VVGKFFLDLILVDKWFGDQIFRQRVIWTNLRRLLWSSGNISFEVAESAAFARAARILRIRIFLLIFYFWSFFVLFTFNALLFLLRVVWLVIGRSLAQVSEYRNFLWKCHPILELVFRSLLTRISGWVTLFAKRFDDLLYLFLYLLLRLLCQFHFLRQLLRHCLWRILVQMVYKPDKDLLVLISDFDPHFDQIILRSDLLLFGTWL